MMDVYFFFCAMGLTARNRRPKREPISLPPASTARSWMAKLRTCRHGCMGHIGHMGFIGHMGHMGCMGHMGRMERVGWN